MPKRILVILPPLLLLLPLSCLLTFYYILPQLHSQSIVLPSPHPPHSPLPSCENISSPISPEELSLWQMLRPLLDTLEVCRVSFLHPCSDPHPHDNLLKVTKVPYYLTDGSLLFLVRWIHSVSGHFCSVMGFKTFVVWLSLNSISSDTCQKQHKDFWLDVPLSKNCFQFRNCSLPKDDIDISVDLSWWRWATLGKPCYELPLANF